MVSEKFSSKNRNFTENVGLINFFATQQIAQLNQLFQFLHLVHIYGHGFYELSRMVMRKNVINEVSKDSPITCTAYCFQGKGHCFVTILIVFPANQ